VGTRADASAFTFSKRNTCEYVVSQSRIQRPRFLDRYREQYGSQPLHACAARLLRLAARLTLGILIRCLDYENTPDVGSGAGFSKGMRVRHPTFGVGSIYQVEGQGEMQKVSVIFHDQTFKSLW